MFKLIKYILFLVIFIFFIFDPVETQTLIDRWKEKNIEVIYQERMGDS